MLKAESQIIAHCLCGTAKNPPIFNLIPCNPLHLLRGLSDKLTKHRKRELRVNIARVVSVSVCAVFARLTPCVAQFAACSYSVGWYLLLAGTLQFMNLRER